MALLLKVISICTTLVVFGLYLVSDLEAQEQSSRIAYSHKVRLSYYPVEGKNSSELKQSMLERGPIGHQKKRFFAYTLWHLRIGRSRWQKLAKLTKQSDLLCRISVHLPYWPAQKESSAELSKQWEHLIKNMIAHESNHVRNAVRACRTLLGTKGSAAYLAVVARRLKLRDQSYDLRTRHGVLEGVFLEEPQKTK